MERYNASVFTEMSHIGGNAAAMSHFMAAMQHLSWRPPSFVHSALPHLALRECPVLLRECSIHLGGNAAFVLAATPQFVRSRLHLCLRQCRFYSPPLCLRQCRIYFKSNAARMSVLLVRILQPSGSILTFRLIC